MVVGGIYQETDLLAAANSTAFRSYPNTGLYLHGGANISGVEYGWAALDLTQQQQLISLWNSTGPQSLELGYSGNSAWASDYTSNFLPAGVVAGEISANVPTTDSNGYASSTDAFATLPASNITGWEDYVNAFRDLSVGAVNSIYPVYAPNMNVKDSSRVTIQAWTEGPFATSSFFADVREMALYGGGISVDAPPQQFFHNIPAGANGQGHAEYQAITEGEIAWANANNLHSIWIISPNTSGTNYNAISQQLVRTLETNATGSQADIPSEYVVENYGTSSSIETYNPIGSEDQPNTQMGVALWLAGYEQGRTGDLQLTASANGSTHLNVTRQTTTSLGGQDTTISLPTTGRQASSYTIVLHNTSTNSSNWYIPNLSATQTGQRSAWSVQILLNGYDITGYVLGSGGFTFNATANVASAGLVLNPGDSQTLTVNFDPLNSSAAASPYALELTGLAHPGASDPFASLTFVAPVSVPEPATLAILGTFGLLLLPRVSRTRTRTIA